MPKVQSQASRAPAHPSDLTARRFRQPRQPANPSDSLIQHLLDCPDATLGGPFELRMVVSLFVETKSHPVEGIFQDPTTHRLFMAILPLVPAQPLIIHMDRFDGNDVSAPGAPIWASRILARRDAPLQLCCSGEWLRDTAWRWTGPLRSSGPVVGLRRLAIVKFLDSFLKIHRIATQGINMPRRKPQPRPTLRNVELVAETIPPPLTPPPITPSPSPSPWENVGIAFSSPKVCE
ncbi:hypothetical protein DICSQDRAFT_158255 [Dichomitus squalens LYAD-421 SS1]|uniref:Uncharacterized protein n=1 Tax=Dichomitus squalens (strain LYAD-421) TaxID=732165 RepID=R7SIJ5_DICSQ|nr:uncharacterized protein DICSQDRAFT_158255 [Dichomitus squalens LYAD-421 SS1]EJF55545.1 hypothetical protein DICSQDRAFT_158255 [Dichomitus squalens LYAD-421 SS1]